MDDRTFLGLEATHNPHRWYLPVVPGLTTSERFLFGGCGLGAAIAAMEATTGRPVVWATAQYLSYTRPPDVLDIDVTVSVAGRGVTQARAVGHVGDREILTVNAALGDRDFDLTGQWETMPQVASPEECPPRVWRGDTDASSLFFDLDMRMANARGPLELDGVPGDGHASLWARMPGGLAPSATALAVLGDWVPFGVGQALGRFAGGNSLDNTLRVVRIVPTEWVLLDVRIHAVERGFGHGLVHLWATDGTLMATASQSCIVREHPPERAAQFVDAARRQPTPPD